MFAVEDRSSVSSSMSANPLRSSALLVMSAIKPLAMTRPPAFFFSRMQEPSELVCLVVRASAIVAI